MSRIVDFLYDPNLVLTFLTAIAAFATVLGLAMPWMQRDQLKSRLKTVSTRREELRAKQQEDFANRHQKGQLRQDPVGFMKQVVDQLNLREMLESETTLDKLAQAGFRGQGPIFTFMFFRFATPIVFCAGTIIYLFAVNDHDLTPTLKLCASFGGFLAGFYAPNVFLENIIQKRQESIMKGFPDSLDLLLICVEAGMSIEVAFNKVSKEVGGASPELAEELGLTTAELSYLPDRKVAYTNLAKRTGHPGVKAVCTSLNQAERYGTPLGTALRVCAQESRQTRMNEAEKKAAALPAKLTVPMIGFFLPVLFVVILGPAIIQLTGME